MEHRITRIRVIGVSMSLTRTLFPVRREVNTGVVEGRAGLPRRFMIVQVSFTSQADNFWGGTLSILVPEAYPYVVSRGRNPEVVQERLLLVNPLDTDCASVTWWC